MKKINLINGDCIEQLKQLEDNSIDSVVTDPPYGLKFMNKHWDHTVPSIELWTEVLRVLKPGGHLLSFGGTRTYHRMAVNIEDAGFEIRDQLQWLYGSGFPKSHNVGKKLDEWDGYGTALKPSNEPIVLARKPLSEKTIVDNVLKHGTGALNIDGSRIGGNKGRWPANTLLDESAAEMLDEQSGELQSRPNKNPRPKGKFAFVEQKQSNLHRQQYETTKGGASRFFYVAKASKRERNAGLEGMDAKFTKTMGDGIGKREHNPDQPSAYNQNHHPTVKPIKLMRYLCRLITPPGGTVLDPFMGSGTTGIAAADEGFGFVGIELEPEYFEIASRRIEVRDVKEIESADD